MSKKNSIENSRAPAVGLRRLVRIFAWIRQKACAHCFDYADLIGRQTADGSVTWPCWKCGKVFVMRCGLDVLQHGKVEKNPNKRNPTE